MNAYRHPKCYARSLGNCSTDISREHYFSRGILELMAGSGEGIRATGMPGLGDEPRRMPPDALAAKVLCRAHNAALSPLDQVGLEFFRLFIRLPEEVLAPGPLRTREVVRGNPIERWMLKALCGFLAAGGATRADGTRVTIEPPSSWIRILFGHDRMPKGWGLYITQKRSDGEFGQRSLFVGPRFLSGRVSAEACLGAVVEVQGVEFSLALVDPPPERIALMMWQSPARYRVTDLVFRNETSYREHTVAINWKPKQPYPSRITLRCRPATSKAPTLVDEASARSTSVAADEDGAER